MKSNLSEEMKHLNLCEQIKQQIDLADYVRSCGIELTKHGKNDLKGLCPFHNDTNPSMIITPSKGLYHCPVCGKGGSIIDYASDYHNTNLKITIQVYVMLLRLKPTVAFAHHSYCLPIDWFFALAHKHQAVREYKWPPRAAPYPLPERTQMFLSMCR